MYEVIYYWDHRGDIPVREFIELLPLKTQGKIQVLMDMLGAQGPFLRRPHADKVRGPIYELRIRSGSDQLRILYAFIFQNKIVLLHIFRKKTQAIGPRDIELAENRLNYFRSYYHEET